MARTKDKQVLRFIEPQLASLVDRPPKGDWLHEIKYDGYRTELIIDNGKARACTRRGADWSVKYQPIVNAAAELPVKNAIIDGEIVGFEPDGRATIEAFRAALSSDPHALYFMAFDLLHLDGQEMRDLPCVERRARLEKIVAGNGAIRFSEHVEGNGEAFYEHACALGLEGIVSKRPGAPYRSGRTDAWVKTKCYQESELVIAGIQRERGKPSYAVMASVGQDRAYVGSAFIALPREQREILYALAEAGGGAKPTGYQIKKNFPAEWIEPRLIGRVKHLRGEDTLRHARLVEIRA